MKFDEDRQAILKDCQAQNRFGEWVPSIEEPYFLAFGRCQCRCSQIFWGRKRYRAHYALEHIMGLD